MLGFAGLSVLMAGGYLGGHLSLSKGVGPDQTVFDPGPTDWTTVKGDMEYAPGQHNVGDYVSLASDGLRFVAAWTDGRDGRSRIHVRLVTPK